MADDGMCLRIIMIHWNEAMSRVEPSIPPGGVETAHLGSYSFFNFAQWRLMSPGHSLERMDDTLDLMATFVVVKWSNQMISPRHSAARLGPCEGTRSIIFFGSETQDVEFASWTRVMASWLVRSVCFACCSWGDRINRSITIFGVGQCSIPKTNAGKLWKIICLMPGTPDIVADLHLPSIAPQCLPGSTSSCHSGSITQQV